MAAIQDLKQKQLQSLNTDGTQKVTVNAGTAIIGQVYRTISSTVANGPTLLVSRLPSAAATTNATVVKASAGRIVKIIAYNATAAVKYLKLYNKATAPTVGTDTPILTIPLKPNDLSNHEINGLGMQFATGIGYALTGAAADNDTTALVAGDVVGLNIIYI